MKIQVTQNHIDRGRRMSAKSCPVALAIYDKIGIVVGISSSMIGHRSQHNNFGWFETHLLDTDAQAIKSFVANFDETMLRSGDPEPFEFTIPNYVLARYV